jgi:hypothetical protein
MLCASSIRYGGLIVDAVDCDYNSFKELGLLCPICKRSVFLVASTARGAHSRKNKDGSITAVKSASVVSHFSHHKDVSAFTVSDCELRSRQITIEQRERIASVARHQRLRTMQRWIWQMLQSSYQFDKGDETRVAAHYAFTYNSALRGSFVHSKTTDFLVEKFCARQEEAIERLPLAYDSLRSQFTKATIYLDCVDDWTSGIDRQMQLAICAEVTAFLCTNRQKVLLGKMMQGGIFSFLRYQYFREITGLSDEFEAYQAYYKEKDRTKENMFDRMKSSAANEIRRFEDYGRDDFHVFLSHVFNYTTSMICLVRWADEFEKVAKNK